MAIAGRVAIVPKGDYDKNVSYKRLDCVKYLNVMYVAKKDVPIGTAITDESYWMKSVEGGGGSSAVIDDTQSSTLTTYSSDKIDKLFEGVSGKLPYKIVTSLPEIGDENTLYFVPSTSPETNNVYDEYIYIDGSWEIIGSTAVDLTNYYKKNEVDTLLEDKLNTTGDASEVTVDFEEATERVKPTTGEKLKLMMGKVAKLFTDLKTIAFSGSYNDLSDTPTIPTLTNSLTATVAGTALDATQGKILNDKLGSTDISGVGDGSVTGALSTLNSNFKNLGNCKSFSDTPKTSIPTSSFIQLPGTLTLEKGVWIIYGKCNFDKNANGVRTFYLSVDGDSSSVDISGFDSNPLSNSTSDCFGIGIIEISKETSVVSMYVAQTSGSSLTLNKYSIKSAKIGN